MTEDLARDLGRAVGTWLEPGDRIAVGRDARDSGPTLQAAFMEGVRSTGVHTMDLGVAPSPAIQLYVRDHGFAAGGIVTASHNPPEFNGIKLIAPDGTETGRAEEDAVEAVYRARSFRSAAASPGGHEEDAKCPDHYLDAVLAQVDQDAIRQAALKVVLDPGGGAGCVTAPRLLERLGVETVCLSCELDGDFSDRPSEPTPENSARCMAAVKEHGADLGALQDGDADRAVFIDEQGGYVWGDQSLALGMLHELRRHPKPDRIACTAVSSSSCVQDAVDMAGGELHLTVVGSPIVAREMIRLGAVFGGEDNGGLMFARHQLCRDGLMALAFVLELVATTGRPLSDLVAEIPRYALVKHKVPVPEARKEAVLEAFRAAIQDEADIQDVDARDGVKAYLDEGWVLVRPSGTEPIFRVQGEAKDEVTATRLVERFQTVLEAVVERAAA